MVDVTYYDKMHVILDELLMCMQCINVVMLYSRIFRLILANIYYTNKIVNVYGRLIDYYFKIKMFDKLLISIIL